MRSSRIAIIGALAAATVLGGCSGSGKKACLPQGEKATVLRKGSDQGQLYVTLKRSNGEEVTCLGDSTPVLLSEGDVVDGWTMTRADPTKAP